MSKSRPSKYPHRVNVQMFRAKYDELMRLKAHWEKEIGTELSIPDAVRLSILYSYDKLIEDRAKKEGV